jgi:L-fuconolactonase
MSTATARIDAHVHLWEIARGDYDWMSPSLGALYRDFGPGDLEPLLRAARVDQAMLVQAAATVAETRFLLELAHRSPHIAGVVGWVDFESAEVHRTLETFLEDDKFKGVRPMIQFLPEPRWMLEARVRPAWEAVVALDVAVDFLVAPVHLDPLYELLSENPAVRGVIDHGAKPDIAGGEFTRWSAAITRIARATTVACKLSGLVTEAGSGWNIETLRPYVDVLLSEFGPGRLMFGSDWPVLTLASDYARWHETASTLLNELSDAERAAVFGGTAARFYRLAAVRNSAEPGRA